ncbi:MAG: amidohydrolase family protein [Pseudomonadota bacterium]
MTLQSHTFISTLAAGALTVLLSGCAADGPTPVVEQQTSITGPVSAFIGVDVLPMDREIVLKDQTVIVRDDRIDAIGPASDIAIPENAIRIEAQGKLLMPGLADMHAHIYPCTDLSNPATCTMPEHQLLNYAATGVTLVRDTSGSPQHANHARKLSEGEWFGPELYFTSPVLEGENAVWSFARKVLTPEEADAVVKYYADGPYWGVKIYHTLRADVFRAIMDAGRKYDIPIIGHVPFEVGIAEVLDAGMYTIEHMRGFDADGLSPEQLAINGGRSAVRFGSILNMTEARKEELIAKTVENDVHMVPTFVINDFLMDKEGRAEMTRHPRYARFHPDMKTFLTSATSLDALFPEDSIAALGEAKPVMMDLVRRIHKAGGVVLTGTDVILGGYVPGFSVIEEIEALETAGLSRFDALVASTRDAAMSVGQGDDNGTVEVGKEADLILLDGNPLEALDALRDLSGVMIDGRWQTMEELEAIMDAKVAGYDDNTDSTETF